MSKEQHTCTECSVCACKPLKAVVLVKLSGTVLLAGMNDVTHVEYGNSMQIS